MLLYKLSYWRYVTGWWLLMSNLGLENVIHIFRMDIIAILHGTICRCCPQFLQPLESLFSIPCKSWPFSSYYWTEMSQIWKTFICFFLQEDTTHRCLRHWDGSGILVQFWLCQCVIITAPWLLPPLQIDKRNKGNSSFIIYCGSDLPLHKVTQRKIWFISLQDYLLPLKVQKN